MQLTISFVSIVCVQVFPFITSRIKLYQTAITHCSISNKKKTSFYIIHMHNQMNLYHCLSYGINNISLSLSCFNSMANYIFSHLGYSLFTTWFTTMGFYSPNAPINLKNWEVFFPTNNLVLIEKTQSCLALLK